MTQHAEEQPPTELPTTDCTICRHPQAADIDAGLLGGTPIRTVAGTYGLSRSAVGRHRVNHLSAEAITDPPQTEDVRPLQIIDVHKALTALADRLEKVVEQAARTRKATAAVGATRELRQTLQAIAEVQANDKFQLAASAERLSALLDQQMASWVAQLIDFVAGEINPELRGAWRDGGRTGEGWTGPGDVARIAGHLMAEVLRRGALGESARVLFGDIDTSEARAYREGVALKAAERMEAEVQRRVEAELRRRENQARPAIEAREVRAIEGGPAWTA